MVPRIIRAATMNLIGLFRLWSDMVLPPSTTVYVWFSLRLLCRFRLWGGEIPPPPYYFVQSLRTIGVTVGLRLFARPELSHSPRGAAGVSVFDGAVLSSLPGFYIS